MNVASSSNGSLAPSPNTLNAPIGLAMANDGTLFVVDSGNNRILIYPHLTKYQASKGFGNIYATEVIGAPSLFDNGTRQYLSFPTKLAFDDACNCLWDLSSLPGWLVRYSNVLTVAVNNSVAREVQVSFTGRTPTVTISNLESCDLMWLTN